MFRPDGFIAETITFEPGTGGEKDHWWFERGMPVRQVKDGREFGRVGDRWVAQGGAGEVGTKKKRPAKTGAK